MLQNLVKKAFSKEMTQEEFYTNYARDIASNLSSSGLRKKGFVDIMGILAILNYLKDQGFECKTERSLHKSPAILEEFEITDIYYNNYRIDVITNFNTNITKIPKTHTDFDIMPDFYIVVKMVPNLTDFRILGYVKPEDVIMSYHDTSYYYPDKRFPIRDLFNIISEQRKTLPTLIDKHTNCEAMFLRFVEGELTRDGKKAFIKHLTTCENCTKSFQSFEKYHKNMKTIEKHPMIYQNLYEKIISFNPVLYKKVKGKEKQQKKNYFSDFVHKVYDFSDNTIDFISNLHWDEKQQVDTHKNLSKKQEVELIFKNKPVFSLDKFSQIIKRRKVALLLALAVFVICGMISLISFGINKSRMNFDDSKFVSSNDIDYVNQESDFYDSEKGETYQYDGLEISPVEYEGNKMPINPSDVIKNISWEVSSKVSDDTEFLGFLQAVGKNIKLRLENDLIMSKEIPTNKNIKVDVQFSSSSSTKGLKMVKSSGSNIVDDLIQKNIIQAFDYMEPPKKVQEGIELTLVIDL